MSPGRWASIIALRWRSIVRRTRVDQDLDDEVRFHIDERTRELVGRGLSDTEARQQALRAFGGVEQRKEECRDARRVGWLDDLVGDTRYALRAMRRAPAFTAIAVISLALGIGANTAIFSAINAVMFRPLPLPHAEELVQLHWSAREFPQAFVETLEGGGGRSSGGGDSSGDMFPYATWTSLDAEHPGFSAVVAFSADTSQANVGIAGGASSARVLAVSGNYFTGLGVTSQAGRLMSPADDRLTAPAVAVASASFWRNRLGGSHGAVGAPLVINGEPFTLVGVASDTFFGLEPGVSIDLWIPIAHFAQHVTRRDNDRLPYLSDPTLWWLRIAGRRAAAAMPSAVVEQANAAFRRSINATEAPTADVPRLEAVPIATGIDTMHRALGPSLVMLMGMVALVLLITCANVGGLLLERATAREREIAVRLSLGVRRSRLVRQLLTESLVLALMGGAAALVMTFWTYPAVMSLLSSAPIPSHLELAVDGNILGFTAVVSLLAGTIFGLAPALRASRVRLIGSLRQRTSTFASRGFTLGKLLVGGQVALAFVLIVAAALFGRTLQQLHAADLGFARDNLLLFSVQPGLNGYEGARLDTYYAELHRRIASIPGVTSATFARRPAVGGGSGSSGAVLRGAESTEPVSPSAGGRHAALVCTVLRGAESTEPVSLFRHEIGPRYFETLGIGLVSGRAIDARDTRSAAHAVVVNETLARRFFGGREPLGSFVEFGSSDVSRRYQIVGVARDVKYSRIRSEIPPTVYLPSQQFFGTLGAMSFLVRSSEDIATVMLAIQREAQSLDATVPVTGVRTQLDAIDATLAAERTFAMLSAVLGALALALASIGLYGTMRYSVSRRRSEIGIRMALGARRASVVGMVLADCLRLGAAGAIVGVAAAIFSTQVIASQLYGVAPHDLGTIALAAGLLVVVGALAVALPARDAASVDPVIALRSE